MDTFYVTLRRLTVCDDRFVASLFSSEQANRDASALDAKTHALARIAALIAVDAPPQSYTASIDSAHEAGASDSEIVGILIAALPALGTPRVVSAASKLGLALGYDLDSAIESGVALHA